MNVSRGDQRHARAVAARCHRSIAVHRQGRDAARRPRRFDQERLLATALIPTARSPASGSNTPIKQTAGVLGDIGEGEAAFSLGGLTTASGQELTEPAITMAVHRPEQNRAGIDQRDFGSDDQFETGLLGGDVSTDRARQTVPIGDGHPGIAQPGRLGDELVG